MTPRLAGGLHLVAALLVGAGAGYATAQMWISPMLAVAIGVIAGVSAGLTIRRAVRARRRGSEQGDGP